MRKYIYIGLFFLLCVGRASAQFTLVSGTVTDLNALPYACGTISASIINLNGQSLYLNGVQFSPQPSATKLGCATDPSTSRTAGAFTVQLADNTQIKCGSGASIVTCATQTQWLFTANSTGIPPPQGSGPQFCTTQLTISGGSQTISLTGCPALANSGNGSPATFNVKAPPYGAKGDTQLANNNCTLSTGSPNMSCTGATFNATVDPGKRANCGLSLGSGLFFPVGTTIASISNSTTAVLTANANGNTSIGACAWGTVDDAAINQAVTAWLAAIQAGPNQGTPYVGSPSPPPVLYFPKGGYTYCGTTNISMIDIPANAGGELVTGDVSNESWLLACDSNANAGAKGFFINQGSGGKGLVVKNLSFTSSLFPSNSGVAVFLQGSHRTEDVYCSNWNANTCFESNGSGYNLNLVVDKSGVGGSGGAVICQSCNDEFHFGGSSNNAANSNTLVSGAFGLANQSGPRFINWLNDEGSCSAGCFRVQGASDLWIIGSSLFAVNGGGLVVDGNSFVHLDGGVVAPFFGDNNQNGLIINNGGIVQSVDVRYSSTGSGKCITNNGLFYDNGGNTCESQFPILSGTSTGTAAVLTVNLVTANVSTNCSVGDSLMVQGAGIAGYNGYYQFGITAVGTNTISYTTVGSNLGALGAGGFAFCRNLQNFSGTLPKALLNNPVPNTCVITGTFVATVTGAPMCNFKLQSATNISFISASSTTTTACTVAPVVTISDGTLSQTLTITTAKSQWASNVDASTGVGTTIFKPNGTIQITNTAGTCTTPPTNFAVSYNISPILSN